MRVLAIYHKDSEATGAIDQFSADYARFQPGQNLELLTLETKAGADLAELYGLTEYPAILALSDDGHLLRLWQGTELPRLSELTAYASS